MVNQAHSMWKKFYVQQQKGMLYPNETLVRFLKGTYMPAFKKSYKGKKVLDIGFGSGNNTMFLGSLGMALHGIEVDRAICEQGKARLEAVGYKGEFRVGTNSDIPFPDKTFDYLVSWDVIHYEGNEANIVRAIEEYHRVLKPGGWLLLSTVAPHHTILRGSKITAPHCYTIGLRTDFRKGQQFFYFDSPEYIKHYFAKQFINISVGRVTLDYFAYINDTFTLNAVNRSNL